MTLGATAAAWISWRRASRLSPGSTVSGGGSRNRRHQHHPGSSPRRPNAATTSGQRSAVATSSWMLTTGQPDRSLAKSRSASHRPSAASTPPHPVNVARPRADPATPRQADRRRTQSSRRSRKTGNGLHPDHSDAHASRHLAAGSARSAIMQRVVVRSRRALTRPHHDVTRRRDQYHSAARRSYEASATAVATLCLGPAEHVYRMPSPRTSGTPVSRPRIRYSCVWMARMVVPT